jgi:carbamoyltransferase
MVNEKKWNELFGFKRRDPEEKIGQQYMDMALAVQQVTEEVVIKLASEAKRLTGCENLCMAGGVALNGVAAGKLDRSGLYSKIFIQPAAGDAGGALGAAYAANYIYYNAERIVDEGGDDMKGCFLGPQYSDLDIIVVANKHKADYELVHNEEQLIKQVAQYIAEGKVVGWMQGRMEFGPRALGARSILADARDPDMKNKLNHAIKFREGFRPFAPIVPMEYVSEYFEQERASPYMMFVKPVRQEKREQLPSVTHRDHSARLQTVHSSTNPRLWKLLNEFKRITGCAVMINTSFNIKDEPIVNTPYEAYNCFRNSGMDYLIAGNIIFSKSKKQV